jgi:hypothetical protein
MPIIFPELEKLLIELLTLKKFKKTAFNSFILEHIEKSRKKIIMKKIVNLLYNMKRDESFNNLDFLIIHSKL